jgi:TusA-related sulfurtransferase
MTNLVDARGLSCPQPVLLTLEKIQSRGHGELLVLVDTDTSKENVIRAAGSLGWQVKNVEAAGTEYKLTLEKA